MSLEILQSIEQAEAKADGMRAEAQKQAREILKSVEAACLAQERAAAIEHRALYQQLMEQDRVRVAGELAKKSQGYATERADSVQGCGSPAGTGGNPDLRKDRASWP